MKHVMAMCVVGTVLLMVVAGRAVGQEDAKKNGSEVRTAALTLVDKGKSLAPIIVFKDAPAFTRRAADELAAYIEKVGGVKPKVIEGLPDPLPEKAIWVGFQPKLKELFPKTDFDFKYPEEILIVANDKNLAIVGRDRWDPQHMVVKSFWNQQVIEGWQQEFGTVNAVYTFLQDYLDVRWLWPGETGEDIIKKKTIAFAPFEYRYHPQIRSRFSIFWNTSIGDPRGVISLDWSRLQRMLLDSSNFMYRGIPAGHWTGLSLKWKELHKTHPEYYALQPDGTRSGWPGADMSCNEWSKLCKSNPAVWDLWLEDVEEQLKADPARTVFCGGVVDNTMAGYCVCPNCIAWDVPEAESRFLIWQGHSQEHVALSDRQTRFANQLARKLRERYPDKDYKVFLTSYGPSLPAPLKNKPDDNVIVLHASSWFAEMGEKDPRSPVGTTYSQEFADWAAIGTKNLWWRPNMSGYGGKDYGLPDVPFGRFMENLRHAVKNNCTGICLSVFDHSWPTQGPLYYLMTQLAWNPDQDGYKILDDYYRRGFGPAAGQLKAYWTLMEETRNRKVDGNLAYWKAYDETFFKRAAGLLDEADAILAKEPEIYRKRMAHVRLGLDFTHLMIETMELKEQYGASLDVKIADRLRENMKKLKNIIDAQSTNYMRVSPSILQSWLDPNNLTASSGRLTPTGLGGEKSRADVPGIAEKTGWTLVFSDDFKRTELGKDWVVVDGKWKVDNGFLWGSGTLISAQGFPSDYPPGFLRMEFEAVSDVKPIIFFKDKPAPKVGLCDLSSFIHAQPLEKNKNPFSKGYFFQFGGELNAQNKLVKNGQQRQLDSAPKKLISQNATHKVVVENDKGQLHCFVDGELLLHDTDKQPVVGVGYDRVGFYFVTPFKVSNVKVYVKRLPDDMK